VFLSLQKGVYPELLYKDKISGLKNKRREQLESELNRIIPEIIKLGVEKIILFGSLASEEMKESNSFIKPAIRNGRVIYERQ